MHPERRCFLGSPVPSCSVAPWPKQHTREWAVQASRSGHHGHGFEMICGVGLTFVWLFMVLVFHALADAVCLCFIQQGIAFLWFWSVVRMRAAFMGAAAGRSGFYCRGLFAVSACALYIQSGGCTWLCLSQPRARTSSFGAFRHVVCASPQCDMEQNNLMTGMQTTHKQLQPEQRIQSEIIDTC